MKTPTLIVRLCGIALSGYSIFRILEIRQAKKFAGSMLTEQMQSVLSYYHIGFLVALILGFIMIRFPASIARLLTGDAGSKAP